MKNATLNSLIVLLTACGAEEAECASGQISCSTTSDYLTCVDGTWAEDVSPCPDMTECMDMDGTDQCMTPMADSGMSSM
jgi:hypothetical protein